MTLLESISTETLRADAFRFAIQVRAVEFLREQGFDDESVSEMLELLGARGFSDAPDELCDGPFRSKPQLQKEMGGGRFSDGSFPVFYSALEPETAEAEIQYHFAKSAGTPTGLRTAYYSRFSCRFHGVVKDLRPKHADWPDLTHSSDYQFCKILGKEAVILELDGLETPSARRSDGTNLPVLRRPAISNPVVHTLVALTLDPSTGEVALTET